MLLRIALLLAVLGLAACGTGERTWYPETDSLGDEDDIDVEQPPAFCGGSCVTVAPATFTGPSLFWFGALKLAPLCPDDAPHQGIEGFLDDPPSQFARECLITPSDACADEGETCAPIPAEDFGLCIHHPGADANCADAPYPDRRALFDVARNIEVTLCCRISKLF